MGVFHPSKPNPRKPAPAKLLAPPLTRTRAMNFNLDRVRACRDSTNIVAKEPKR